MKSSRSFITGLLAGAAIGGVLALLYAPKSGKETREQIKKKFEDLEKELEGLKGKASQKSSQVKDDIAARIAELQREIENLSREV
jgi:gas vesicle protein